MTEQTENLVLELLRAVRADIGNIKQDIRDIIRCFPSPMRDEHIQHRMQLEVLSFEF